MIDRPARLHTNDGRPRHTIRITPAMLEAYRLRREGLPRAVIAERYGIALSTVSRWCEMVEAAQADDRNLAKVGR